ncbi:protein HGH1 homolog [Phlebotomus argentipes]|uniref:protein HGH1 homolog n=1 Tax=Phlebotomus argentipes TaxID=94469 RepID=UPI0028930C70|nr:protein HGH1 homolog [Phlebotomus argentipes]
METLSEFKAFLQKDSRLDLKAVALAHILSLSGNVDSRELLSKSPDILGLILDLTTDPTAAISKDATFTLVNISSEEIGAKTLLKECPGLLERLFSAIFDEKNTLADAWCMILCNMSRQEALVEEILQEFDKDVEKMNRLVICFTRKGFNKSGCNLHYIGPAFSNFSQCSKGRELLCDREKMFFQRIMPFVEFKDSVIRRGGAVGFLKNICFDSTRHDWLLSEEVNVLPYILLPLAGPEEFDEEDNDKLPIELQYLSADKEREDDPDIRKMLLECLLQLCATRKGREFLRQKGTYEILRELHKWEVKQGDESRQTVLACENVVDVLIRTEDEIGEDNLKHVEIPEEVNKQLEKLDVLNDENVPQ